MARRQLDIQLNETGEDLEISAGDFAGVESTEEHQRQIIANNNGDFKENPTICVGAAQYLNDDPGLDALAEAISKEFTNDGMTVESVSVAPNGHIETHADY